MTAYHSTDVGVSNFKAEFLRRGFQSAVQKCPDARHPEKMEVKNDEVWKFGRAENIRLTFGLSKLLNY
jgi:hypothetical protein